MKKILMAMTAGFLATAIAPTVSNAFISKENYVTSNNIIGQLSFKSNVSEFGFEGVIKNNNIFYGAIIGAKNISFYQINNENNSTFKLITTIQTQQQLKPGTIKGIIVNNNIYYGALSQTNDSKIATIYKLNLSTNQVVTSNSIIVNNNAEGFLDKNSNIQITQVGNKIIFAYNLEWETGNAVVVYDTSTNNLAAIDSNSIINEILINKNLIYLLNQSNLTIFNLTNSSQQVIPFTNEISSLFLLNNQIYGMALNGTISSQLLQLNINNNKVTTLLFSNILPANASIAKMFNYNGKEFIVFSVINMANNDLTLNLYTSIISGNQLINQNKFFSTDINSVRFNYDLNIINLNNKVAAIVTFPFVVFAHSITLAKGFLSILNLDTNQTINNNLSMKNIGRINQSFIDNGKWYNSIVTFNNDNSSNIIFYNTNE